MIRQKVFLVVPILLPLLVCSDVRLQDSLRLLAEADRLAMLYNWPKAARSPPCAALTSGSSPVSLLAAAFTDGHSKGSNRAPAVIAMSVRPPFELRAYTPCTWIDAFRATTVNNTAA